LLELFSQPIKIPNARNARMDIPQIMVWLCGCVKVPKIVIARGSCCECPDRLLGLSFRGKRRLSQADRNARIAAQKSTSAVVWSFEMRSPMETMARMAAIPKSSTESSDVRSHMMYAFF